MADKESNDLSHQPEDTLIRLKGGLCGVDLAEKCSKETVINFKKYCREYVKNITQKGFVEPTLDLPARASDRLRESLDAVIDVRSKSLKVTNNNNPTGLTSNNKTAMVSPVSTSGRAPRRAAMKARAGCFSAFHLPQKLRRPTNFDPKSGLLLPTIPQTPDFVRDVLAVADDSDTEAPAGSSTFTTNRVDPESNNRNSQEIFKIPPAPFVEPPKVERASRARSRRTKASQASVIDPAMELVAEVSRSRRITRSRSKQSRQGPHDPETPTKNTEPVKRSTRNMRSTQSKKLKVSEAGTPSSTFLVEQEQPMEVVHDQEDTLVENKVNVTHILRQKSHPSSRRVPRSTNEEERVATADDRTINGAPGALDMDYQTAEDLAGCPIIRRSRSVPVLFGSDPDLSEIVDDGVLQKRPSNVEDPMTTFNPIASELDEPAKKGSKRTSDEASSLSNPKRSRIGGSPSVVAGSELKIYDTAPRTRSKHRNQMNNVQSSSKSVNKENDRIDIGQMMKAMEKPGRPTPIKPPKLMKKKQDIPKKNGEDPYKKKKDILSQKTEEIKKYREMKEKKAAELRAAAEKEKQLQLEREQKEREERERLAKAEKQRQKEEALMKKKQLNMQKAQEAEERRRKEEELRLARHKELEEEQRRAAEARQRQVEEAERLAALRKVQEKEEEALRLRMEKMAEKEKLRALKAGMLKEYGDPDDIGIADGDAEEADGKPPRRPSPKWAESANRTKQLKVQSYLLPSRVFQFYEIKFESPDLRDIFGSTALLRPRTSSAVWAATPPHLSDS